MQAEAIDYCQIDVCRLGGVNEVLAVLLLAAKFGVPVCAHAGGLGLCEYVQHLCVIDYVCVSGSLDDRTTEFADHLHEHFVAPGRRARRALRAPVGAGLLGRSASRVVRRAFGVPRWCGVARGVTALGLGLTAPIGNMFAGVSDEDAQATIDAAWDAGIRYFDTAPLYGHGVSERRLGRAPGERGRGASMCSRRRSVGCCSRPAPSGRRRSSPTSAISSPSSTTRTTGVMRSLEESLARSRHGPRRRGARARPRQPRGRRAPSRVPDAPAPARRRRDRRRSGAG